MIGAASLWGYQSPLSSTTHPVRPMGPMLLSEIPVEVLEHILSSLPPADILKMKEVSYITRLMPSSLNDLPQHL